MSTFKAWLIANLRYAYLLLFLINLGIGFAVKGIDMLEIIGSAAGGNGWVAFFFLGVVGCVDVPALGERIIGFLFYAAIIVALIFTVETGKIIFIIFSLIYLAAAIIVAIQAWNNFDEVVSRRMAFRNSNAEIFDVRWKYCFDRFFCTFRMLIFLTAECFFIFIT